MLSRTPYGDNSLLPFTAVKNLYSFKEFAPGVVAALQELVGGRIAEGLPSLQNIFVQWLEPSVAFQETLSGSNSLPRDSSLTLSPFLTGTQSPTPQSLLSHPTTSTEAANLPNLNGLPSHKRNSHSSPGLPPLNMSPLLDSRSVYPPVSHRAGQQLVSSVYGDAGSKRTGSLAASAL